MLDRNKIVVDNIFSFKVTFDITRSNDDIKPKTVEECRRRNDWLMWKEAIQAELNSLAKREVFGPVVQTPMYHLLDTSGYLYENIMRKMKL